MANKLKELFFQNQTLRQTVTKNIFWLGVGEFGSRVFRAFFIIFAARILGAAEYGVFSYVLALAGFFTLFSDLGVSSVLTREVAKKPAEASYYFASAFWIKIVLLLFTAILIILVAPYFSRIEAAKAILPFAALLICFDSIRGLAAAYFRGKEKMELEALTTSATNIAITIFGLIILYFAASAKTLTITYTLSAGVGTLIGIVILREQFAKLFIFSKEKLRSGLKIIASAWPLALHGIIGVFLFQIDILMLGYFKTTSDVGFYSAGQKIVQLLYLLPTILAAGLFPPLSRFVGQQNNEKAKALMERGMTTVFSIALPLVAGGVILGKNIINFLYGAEYLPSVSAFQILIFAVLLVFPTTLIGNYIFAYNGQKRALSNTALGAVGNIIFNVILIPIYGIVGAAIATLSAQLIINGLNWRLAKKINGFSTLRYLKKIIFATILMGIMSFIFDKFGLNVIINIILSIGIYFATLYVLKEKILQEIKSLFRAAETQ